MEKIGLLGASGAIGKSISQALDQRQLPYRVIGRKREALLKEFGGKDQVEIQTWNPDDTASIRTALQGLDTVIYLVGVPYDQFQLHPVLMRNTLAAATEAGVKRIVLIGTVYPYGMPQTNPVREDHPRQPTTFKGKMRKEQEDLLLEADAKGTIQGTILRLPDFYGPQVDKSFLHDLFQAAAQNRTANMVGPIDTPHEFIFVPDVGPIVLALAENEKAYGRFWNLAGAGTLTQREIAERVFRMAGKKPRLRVAGKTMLRLVGLFNPLMRELVEMNYLVTNPVIMDDSALRGLLGGIRKTSYDEGLALSFKAAQGKQ
jgi:nucleoside-diphosphate-sugar epimerase